MPHPLCFAWQWNTQTKYINGVYWCEPTYGYWLPFVGRDFETVYKATMN